MVYLVNCKKPRVPQVVEAIKKELAMHQYKFIVAGNIDPKTAHEFVFPEITTIYTHYEEDKKITEEEVESLNDNNIIFLEGQHNIQRIFHSASQKFRTIFPAEIMASTVCNIEKSVQKCVEIAVNAADKKIIPVGTRMISIAGENNQPDTAVVLQPSTGNRIIDTRIVKIICHPYHEEW